MPDKKPTTQEEIKLRLSAVESVAAEVQEDVSKVQVDVAAITDDVAGLKTLKETQAVHTSKIEGLGREMRDGFEHVDKGIDRVISRVEQKEATAAKEREDELLLQLAELKEQGVQKGRVITSRTSIIVALIMLLGTLTVAVGKMWPEEDKAPVPVVQPVKVPSP